ncbi:SDR family NAD(P)-dependent oxidoreductase [Rhizobium sp. L1K21]|uniref:SDR family NAD(P)-dependent oxidoreductase n=1 Tax=Rhizobium sp. L1K21 TaxID=2954933 RepID=UPI00209237ED|nr:glucose 1-dehydrogenase [Rhizobium sp. L1K21]MCO6187577.1 glucose 1-dehydrogenase [Rhizobium sp. L1K21]
MMKATEMFDLSGKCALITGGSSGIGLAIAKAFIDAGAKVAIAGNRSEEVESVASSIGAVGLPADISTRQAAVTLASTAEDALGKVDILVSNAGIEGPLSGISELNEVDYLRVFDVNLHAATWISSALLPGMEVLGGGSLIFMASLSALRGNKSIATYSMSKAALAQLARNIAVAHGPKNIRANAIAPGLIRTPFAEGLMANQEFMERRLQATPLRRVGEAAEIAATALWLASPGGAFVTGQTIVVDGGTLIHDGS